MRIQHPYHNTLAQLFFSTALIMSLLTIALDTHSQVIISRVKDVARLDGLNTNTLIGYGLVAGLSGTGDGAAGFTAQSLNNLLISMGNNVVPQDQIAGQINPVNVAAVMVMAEMEPFVRPGGKIDATIISIGAAQSLQGGVLMTTPLKGADGETYGLAQGSVSIGGFVVAGGGGGGGGAAIQQNHTTVGIITEGVTLVGQNVNHDVLQQPGNILRWLLNNPDFKTATNLQNRINTATASRIATAEDGGAVRVEVDINQDGQIILGNRAFNSLVEAIAFIDELQIETDQPATIIINERTGTITGDVNIRVRNAIVAHGPLRLTIQSTPEVTPAGLGPGGEPVQVNQVDVTAEEGDKVAVIDGTTLGEVITNLNALGYTPRDLIAILEALAQQGAVNARIIKM